MEKISKIIQQNQQALEKSRAGIKGKRLFSRVSPEDFKTIFMLHCNIIIASRHNSNEFEITPDNKEVINQLYFYLIGSDKFKGDLYRGILLRGPLGTGKTTILKAFILTINDLFREQFPHGKIKVFHSKALASEIKTNGLKSLEHKALFIDDIGKESNEAVHYGETIHPVPDIMALRYESGSWTFATGNYSFDTYKDLYGETISDRFKDIFNVIELGGSSYRKEVKL